MRLFCARPLGGRRVISVQLGVLAAKLAIGVPVGVLCWLCVRLVAQDLVVFLLHYGSDSMAMSMSSCYVARAAAGQRHLVMNAEECLVVLAPACIIKGKYFADVLWGGSADETRRSVPAIQGIDHLAQHVQLPRDDYSSLRGMSASTIRCSRVPSSLPRACRRRIRENSSLTAPRGNDGAVAPLCKPS
jgi:hypothetical protein